MNRLTIEYRSCEELTNYPRNANTHPGKQIRQIAASIREFGFANPIITDETFEIIAGHGRLEAAKRLGFDEVPVIVIRGLTDIQKRALRIADNRIAENAEWDLELVVSELQAIFEADIEFDFENLGFETAEIDILFAADAKEGDMPDPADDIPAISEKEPVITRLGDLWLLGKHKLYCGNALDSTSFEALMVDERADMVITDPPYNVPIHGNVCGSGAIKHEEFAMASGEMSAEEFITFLRTALSLMSRFSRDGSVHYIFMDWRHLSEVLVAGNSVYDTFLNLCVWAKTNGGMGSFYRSQHELIFVFRKGAAQHHNNVQLGKFGRNRTNVWTYPGMNIPTKEAREQLALHPTVKPVQLVADAILDCTKRGDIVLDAFAGSGTAILAAERAGRVARAIELEPRYVDVAIRRFQEITGLDARLARDNQTFAEIAAERLDEQLEEGPL